MPENAIVQEGSRAGVRPVAKKPGIGIRRSPPWGPGSAAKGADRTGSRERSSRSAKSRAARSGENRAPGEKFGQGPSVYDIQGELGEAGEEVSVHFLATLLREEGFARLPRRRDDERPPVVRPEKAAIADVRDLDPSPRTFRTAFAGLFLFTHLLEGFDLGALAANAGLPGSRMIPGEQALRSVLTLKLVGIDRKSHVMSHVLDGGLALFAGLNAVPKRSWLASYSSRVGRAKLRKVMELWFDQAQAAGLRRSGSVDLDFHTVSGTPHRGNRS